MSTIPVQLSERTRKVLQALDTLMPQSGAIPQPSQVLVTSYQQLAEATSAGRSTVAEGLRELRERGLIALLPKTYQGSLRIVILNRPDDWTNSYPIVRTIEQNNPQSSGRLGDSSRAGASDSDDDFSDDDERAHFQKISAVLAEFGVPEPFRSQLVKQDLLPAVQAGRITLDDVRAECVRTMREARVWRYPSKVIYKRLKAKAAGQQDPLPLFEDSPPVAAQAESAARQTRRGRGRTTMRRQVQYTEAEREAARERARARIAERAATRGSK